MAAAVLTPLALTGCGDDIQVPNNPDNGEIDPVEGNATVFSCSKGDWGADDGTRTSMDADRHFYWEAGDYIWLDEAQDGSFSTKLTECKLSSPTQAPSANFYLRGKVLSGSKYDILYTGTVTDSPNKVKIAAEQAQGTWNNSTHLGASGDCGVAEAVPNGSGKYSFVVKHKAAYLQIAPYLASSMPAGLKLKSFQVVADNAIAGTYSFNKNGLVTSDVETPSNTIAFTCGTDGFPILKEDYGMSINGCYVVIQPGTHTLTISYTLEFLSTGATITISEDIRPKDYKANSCTYIHHRLNKPYTFDFPDMYYMWDAQQWYWYGVSGYPTVNSGTNANYPQSATDLRWYSTTLTPPAQGTYSAANMPNTNEIYWYIQGTGTIYWDNTLQWTMGGTPYTGGVWLKKKAYITGFNSNTAPNGVDYTRNKPISVSVALTAGTPADTSQYFFLPAFGFYLNGKLGNYSSTQPTVGNIGTYGLYWSSSAIYNGSTVGPSGAYKYGGFNFDFGWYGAGNSNSRIFVDQSGHPMIGGVSGDIVAGLFE